MIWKKQVNLIPPNIANSTVKASFEDDDFDATEERTEKNYVYV